MRLITGYNIHCGNIDAYVCMVVVFLAQPWDSKIQIINTHLHVWQITTSQFVYRVLGTIKLAICYSTLNISLLKTKLCPRHDRNQGPLTVNLQDKDTHVCQPYMLSMWKHGVQVQCINICLFPFNCKFVCFLNLNLT